jgi:hypothetical protein
LDKLDDLNYVVEDMIASPAYPDFVGTYWKGTVRVASPQIILLPDGYQE